MKKTDTNTQQANINIMPTRKPNRLKDYDYSLDGAYFITICAKNHEELFACIDTTRAISRRPRLTRIGEIVENEI